MIFLPLILAGYVGTPATPSSEYYQKNGSSITQVKDDLKSCSKTPMASDPAKVYFTDLAKREFCMRDKGYTTLDGPIETEACTAYKKLEGKILPICAARGVNN